MKVKVKQKFRDKYTGDILFAGEILIISEDRYNEIKAKDTNLVEIVEEKTESAETPEVEPAEIDTTEHLETPETTENQEEAPNEFTGFELENMKVDELRKKAEEMGVDSIGKKEELIKRILGEEENVDEES